MLNMIILLTVVRMRHVTLIHALAAACAKMKDATRTHIDCLTRPTSMLHCRRQGSSAIATPYFVRKPNLIYRKLKNFWQFLNFLQL